MLRNASQNARLHFLLGELKIDKETKEDLVYQFTNKRETSSSKMTVPECQALINELNFLVTGDQDAMNRQRKKILSICHEMDWRAQGKIDWNRLNTWLTKYGYKHKALNDYTASELPKLVTQFQNLLKSYYSKK